MSDRYYNRALKTNSHPLYKEYFKERGFPFGVEQYTTPALQYPDSDEDSELTIINHVWRYGDKYYKLAYEHYGDSNLWWVIAWYNLAPTESHNKIGDVLYIPFPLSDILNLYNV